jgi:hypothetical protein
MFNHLKKKKFFSNWKILQQGFPRPRLYGTQGRLSSVGVSLKILRICFAAGTLFASENLNAVSGSG